MSSRPQTPFARPQLVCCLGSSSALALLALRAWAIALFETGAAPGIPVLPAVTRFDLAATLSFFADPLAGLGCLAIVALSSADVSSALLLSVSFKTSIPVGLRRPPGRPSHCSVAAVMEVHVLRKLIHSLRSGRFPKHTALGIATRRADV
jgi:hypothetical protein